MGRKKNNEKVIRQTSLYAHFKGMGEKCKPAGFKLQHSDWSTVAFKIDRNILDDKFVLFDKELKFNGIYFLVGYEANGSEKVYVGQAKIGNNNDSIMRRLIQHNKSTTEKYRDMWDYAIAVTSENGDWGPTELSALENIFYKLTLGKNLNSCVPNSGGEIDEDAYEEKVRQIKVYLSIIGLSLFEEEAKSDNSEIAYIVSEDSKQVEDIQLGLSKIPEIVTPKAVVEKMLDILPAEVWNRNTVFLDPACKGGEFLRAIYDRLFNCEDLKENIPNEQERLVHILDKQLFGIATSKESLDRTVTKLFGFNRHIVNINNYIEILKGSGDIPVRVDGKNKWVTLKEKIAREFGVESMNIDVVIGNPPYNENNNSGASALYSHFIDFGLKIAKYECMIVPARWIADKPNGIEKNWLDMMRDRKDIIELHDYEDNNDVFKGVQIAGGGVCYFLIDTEYNGECRYFYHTKGDVKTRTGYLNNCGKSIVRNPDKAVIVNKVLEHNERSFKEIIGTTRNFSPNDSYFGTNYTGYVREKDSVNYLRFFGRDTLEEKNAGYVREADLAPGTLNLAKVQKIFIWRNGPSNEGGNIINKPFVGGRNSLCSRSFVPVYNQNGISALNTDEDCMNAVKYLKAKFTRFLISCGRSAIAANRESYRFVPLQDFTSSSDIDWSKSISDIDQQLYRKYGLTQEEIDYIENTIKPMA